jgi:predicted signal transduction protein with EAL and GGDEF domain
VSRVGGDEFVIVLWYVSVVADISPTSAKIMAELSELMKRGRAARHPSIGQVFPQDSDDPTKLLSFADAAMYHAKASGRRNIQFYAAAMSDTLQARMKLESDLHLALERRELELYYQPRVDFRTGAVAGYEALLRWNHPVEGMIMPADFIPIAEDTGLIMPIGEWVIAESCQQVKRWRAAGFAVKAVSVNLSARQFFDRELPARVRAALAAADVAPADLELEITESIRWPIPRKRWRCLPNSQLGVRLPIDDFGTGFEPSISSGFMSTA